MAILADARHVLASPLPVTIDVEFVRGSAALHLSAELLAFLAVIDVPSKRFHSCGHPPFGPDVFMENAHMIAVPVAATLFRT